MFLNPEFDEFFKLQKKVGLRKFKSQHAFAKELLEVLGLSTDYSKDYLKELLNRRKPFPIGTGYVLSDNTKNRLKKMLTSCFDADELVFDDSVFGIEAGRKINVALLTKALISIFEEELLGLSNGSLVEHYYRNLEQETEEHNRLLTITNRNRLYPDDGFANDNLVTKIDMGFHEERVFNWRIRNIGKVKWENRSLIRVNSAMRKVRNKPDTLKLPDLNPGETAFVETIFQSRNHEGDFITQWEIHDQFDQNCFPNSANVLNVTVKVSFED